MPSNTNRIRKKHHSAALLILNRLEKEAVKIYYDDKGNELPPTANQIKCGELYMRKIMPDLKSTELRGKIDNKITISIKRED